MRNTENLSLRLDPEVVRLARRTAEEYKQTLREFFEEALRRHVAAVTRPEEKANLLSSVEEAFLQRMDKRLHDVLERVAALSAKEATDQAHTLQILKRVLFMQVGDQKKTHIAVDQCWKEAVERVRSRGRPFPPEAVQEIEEALEAAQKLLVERTEQLNEARAEAQQAVRELNKVRYQAQERDGEIARSQRRVEELEGLMEREKWVSQQLEAQAGFAIRRKTAAELREEYRRRQLGVSD